MNVWAPLRLAHPFTELICRSEDGGNTIGYLDFVLSIRRPNAAALSLNWFPNPKAAQLDSIALRNGLHNKGQKAVDDGLSFDSGKTYAIGEAVHQFLFGYSAAHEPTSLDINEPHFLSCATSVTDD